MISQIWGGGRRLSRAFALVLCSGLLSHSSALAQTDGMAVMNPDLNDHKVIKDHHTHKVSAAGTLGYGPPGVYPGFQGFGLGFHRGYGYGGDALGVGAEGGYPFYGGPGYPHPAQTCAGSVESIHSAITAARAIPRQTSPFSLVDSAPWRLINRL